MKYNLWFWFWMFFIVKYTHKKMLNCTTLLVIYVHIDNVCKGHSFQCFTWNNAVTSIYHQNVKWRTTAVCNLRYLQIPMSDLSVHLHCIVSFCVFAVPCVHWQRSCAGPGVAGCCRSWFISLSQGPLIKQPVLLSPRTTHIWPSPHKRNVNWCFIYDSHSFPPLLRGVSGASANIHGVKPWRDKWLLDVSACVLRMSLEGNGRHLRMH